MNIGICPVRDDGRREQVSEVWPCLAIDCDKAFADAFEWITHDLEIHSSPGYVCDACPRRFIAPVGICQHLKTEHHGSSDGYIACLMFIRSVNSPWGNPMWCGFCRKTVETARLVDDYALLTSEENHLWKEERAAHRCNHISQHLEEGSQVANWVRFEDHPDTQLSTSDSISTGENPSDMSSILKMVEKSTARTGEISQERMNAQLHQKLKGRWNRTSAVDALQDLVEWLSTADLENLFKNEVSLISALKREVKYGRPNILRKIDDDIRATRDYVPSTSSQQDRNSNFGSGSSRGSQGSTASAAAQSDEDRSDVSIALLALQDALLKSVKKTERKLKILPSRSTASRTRLTAVLEQGIVFVDNNIEEAYRLHTDELATSLNQEMWKFTKYVTNQLDARTSSWSVGRWDETIQLATESLKSIQTTWEAASTRRSAFLKYGREIITRYPSPHFNHNETINIVHTDAVDHEMAG